jgi:hypothetical protein
MKSGKMKSWFRRHRIIATLLWSALTLAALEGILLCYYLNHWITLPSL